MIALKEGKGQSKPSPVHNTTYRIVDNVFLDDVARFSAIACSVVISGVLPLLGCNIDAVLEDIARSNGDARGAAGAYIATRHQLLASTLTRRGFSFSENAMTLKKLLGHNERTGFSETSIIICAVLTGAGICALGISLCLLMQWAVLNGYVLF